MAAIEKSDFKMLAAKLDRIIDLLEGKAPVPTMMTVSEAAEKYGIHTETMYRWIKKGFIPVHRASDRGKIYIDPDEIEEAIRGGIEV